MTVYLCLAYESNDVINRGTLKLLLSVNLHKKVSKETIHNLKIDGLQKRLEEGFRIGEILKYRFPIPYSQMDSFTRE